MTLGRMRVEDPPAPTHHSTTSSKERSNEGEEPPGSAAIWKKVMMCQIRGAGVCVCV